MTPESRPQTAAVRRHTATGSWWRRNAVLLLGVALVVAGVVIFLAAPGSATAFGWTSYSPLPSRGIDWPALYLNQQRVTGGFTAVAGLMLLAGVVGYRFGSRSRTR